MDDSVSKKRSPKSVFAESVETYLRETRKTLNKLVGWRFDNRDLHIDELHVEQFLITERPKEVPRFDKRKDRQHSDSLPFDYGIELTNQAKLYELTQNSSQREQVRWSQFIAKQGLRSILIGAPGSGKSFTTKHAICQHIDEALYGIENRGCRIEDLELPIWITATELTSQNTNNPAEAIKAFVPKILFA